MIIPIIRFLQKLIMGRLVFLNADKGRMILMGNNYKFQVFRHIGLKRNFEPSCPCLFIVRFKFKNFSHEKNIRLSRIPIPLIVGSKGFQNKMWMIDHETDYWQGVYQWDSLESLNNYKRSFVLGIMNNRAMRSTISYETIEGMDISSFMKTYALDSKKS